MNLANRSLREVSELLKNRKITAMELLNGYLEFALKGSCISFCGDSAFEATKKIDEERLTRQPRSTIEAIPFSLKDNIQTEGVLTTCNSRCLKSYTPDKNAFAVSRLLDLGAVLTAKNCMREFSVGKIDDSAFELRNYIDWSGTSKNVNIGAFSLGTDIGMSDFYCGLWTLKPSDKAKHLSEGIITGSPSLEKLTISTRFADDLAFVYDSLTAEDTKGKAEGRTEAKSEPKVLVYDNMNMPDYICNILKSSGFSVGRSDISFLDKADVIYDCVLCTEFFNNLSEIGKPELPEKPGGFTEREYVASRSEGIGFEVKKLILKGSHILSKRHKGNTLKVIGLKSGIENGFKELFQKYDIIAAPAILGDRLSKAAALSGLAEITVPFGDMLVFKLFSYPGNEQTILDAALLLEKRL